MPVEFSTATPSQLLPEHPYSREEIEDYVWRIFESPIRDKARKAQIEKRLVHFIELLPGWVQVLLIECRHAPIRIGSEKALKLGQDVVGDAHPNTLHLNLVDYPEDDDSLGFEYYLSHEIAHNIDNILGRHHALPADMGHYNYFSEQEAPWIANLEKDLQGTADRRKSNLNRGLRKFLQRGYEPEQKPREAFAFILSHYLVENFRAHDPDASKKKWEFKSSESLTDPADLDRHLEMCFPNLWSYYRDQMRPEAMALAEREYGHRQEGRHIAYERIRGRLERSLRYVEKAYGSKTIASEQFVDSLAKDYYTTWQHLLDTLAVRPPNSVGDKVKILFPSTFDPIWGATSTKIHLRDFSQFLRQQAAMFVEQVPNILKEEGIEKFIEYYNNLSTSFEQELADKNQSRARVR